MDYQKKFASGAVEFEYGNIGLGIVFPTLYVVSVLITTNEAPTSAGSATIEYVSADESNEFGGVIYSQNMNGRTAWYRTLSRLPLLKNEKLKITYANPNDRQVGVTIFATTQP